MPFMKRSHARALRTKQVFEKAELTSKGRWRIWDSDLHHSVGESQNSSVDIDWSTVPEALDPAFGVLQEDRAGRKRNQISGLGCYVLQLMKEEPWTVVEFGCGTGHLGLLVAYLRPQCHVVLVECEEFRALMAAKRAKTLGLMNCSVFAGTIQEFEEILDASVKGAKANAVSATASLMNHFADKGMSHGGGSSRVGTDSDGGENSTGTPGTAPPRGWILEPRDWSVMSRFDLGSGLHTCGLLTDAVQSLCVKFRAAYAISPCCYGQIPENPVHPRSSFFSADGEALSTEDFAHIASAAEFSLPASKPEFVLSSGFVIAKSCMNIVDTDRSEWAATNFGYSTSIDSIFPMHCSPKNNVIVGVPPSLHLPEYYEESSPEDYEENLQAKISRCLRPFESLPGMQEVRSRLTICRSEPFHFRLRCKFGIEHSADGDLHYVMFSKGELSFHVDNFHVASRTICRAMPLLRKYLRGSPCMREGLRAVCFLSTLSEDLNITLIYDRPLDDVWDAEALMCKTIVHGDIIGRCKGQVRVHSRNFVIEKLHLADGRSLEYKQVEGSFSNPNGIVNQKALDWLCGVISKHVPSTSNLLELYCGNGNHTVALAAVFGRVIAVELDKALCEAARENLKRNSIENVEVAQLHSEKFCKGILKNRKYLQEGKPENEQIDFKTVLVDPPRAGLDADTMALVANYEYIIYISCNPHRLLENLQELLNTHSVVEMAVFDQFAFTPHLESGLVLQKRQ